MREALSNLIDNAVKYVPAGGRITVRAGGEAMGHRGMAVVMVEDNGPGIAPARREEVFKRFFRGDHTPGAQGTIRIEDVPAPSPTPAPAPSALSAVVAGHGDHEERRDAPGAEPAPGRASMRFVIRIPCEAPGTPAG